MTQVVAEATRTRTACAAVLARATAIRALNGDYRVDGRIAGKVAIEPGLAG